MNTIEELAVLRQRIGGVEHELEQLKRRVASIEREIVAGRTAGEAQISGSVALCGELPPLETAAVEAPAIPEPATVALPSMPPPLPPARPLPKVTELAPPPLPADGTDGLPASEGFAREPELSFLDTIRPWLERAQLWPPSGEANREVQLGAWWATRLGILFAVIGAVFFGVYVSVNTPPWVKFIELLGASLGVMALGVWLERKTPRFGQVVFAGGLALVFFATMAAYTVPGVKVLENRFVAALCQLGVTAAIGAIAWRKHSQPVATLAVVLGYVASWFSFSGGFELFALVSAAGFAALAVIWRRWLDWEVPSVVALAGYWGIYGTLIFGVEAIEGVALPAWVWAFVAGGYAVFFWRDDRAGREKAEVSAREIWVQNAASTAALGLGWWTAWLAFPERIGIFYAMAAAALGLAAWRRARTVAGDKVSAVLMAKALGALTLAVIKWTDPEMTALALLVQAGVMLATNRRLRSRVMATGSLLVVAVSLAYWLDDTLWFPVAAGSLSWIGRTTYLAAFMAWALELARSCGVELAQETRRSIVRVASGVGVGLALLTAGFTTPVGWQPSWLMSTPAVLGAAGFFWKQRAPWIAAGVVGVAAHIALWSRLSFLGLPKAELWGNAWAVLMPTVAGAWWLGRDAKGAAVRVAWLASALVLATLGACVCVGYGASASLAGGLAIAVLLAVAAPWQPARGWLWLSAWALGVGAVGHAVAAGHGRGMAAVETIHWIAAVVPLLGIACLAAWPRGRAQLALESPRGGTQWVTAIFALVFAVAVAVARKDAVEAVWVLVGFSLLAGGLLSWMWVGALRGIAWAFTVMATLVVAARSDVLTMLTAGGPLMAVAWLPALGWAMSSRIRDSWTRSGANAEWTVCGQTWLAGGVTAVAIGSLMAGGQRVGWLTGAAVIAVVLARMGFSAVVEVATGLALLALAYGVSLVNAGGADAVAGIGFFAVVAAAAVAAGFSLVLPPGRIWASSGARVVRDWLYPSAGLALMFALMLSQRGALEPYVTVGWAVAALGWFGLGLFGRLRPARLLGLAGLAVCVPRMFWIDLNSTLYRIGAFCALGGVLLWVGFSYYRFRHLIASDDDAVKNGAPEGDGNAE